jgi:hypothetical protein
MKIEIVDRIYACLDGGRLKIGTRKEDLPRVDDEQELTGWDGRTVARVVAACPKCGKAHIYEWPLYARDRWAFRNGRSLFVPEALRRARDCEEFEVFKDVYDIDHELGWRLVRTGRLSLPRKPNPAVLERLRNMQNRLRPILGDDMAKLTALTLKET